MLCRFEDRRANGECQLALGPSASRWNGRRRRCRVTCGATTGVAPAASPSPLCIVAGDIGGLSSAQQRKAVAEKPAAPANPPLAMRQGPASPRCFPTKCYRDNPQQDATARMRSVAPGGQQHANGCGRHSDGWLAKLHDLSRGSIPTDAGLHVLPACWGAGGGSPAGFRLGPAAAALAAGTGRGLGGGLAAGEVTSSKSESGSLEPASLSLHPPSGSARDHARLRRGSAQ